MQYKQKHWKNRLRRWWFKKLGIPLLVTVTHFYALFLWIEIISWTCSYFWYDKHHESFIMRKCFREFFLIKKKRHIGYFTDTNFTILTILGCFFFGCLCAYFEEKCLSLMFWCYLFWRGSCDTIWLQMGIPRKSQNGVYKHTEPGNPLDFYSMR